MVRFDILGRDIADIRLDHLRDLLLESELMQEFDDAGLDLRISRNSTVQPRPGLRARGGRAA